MGKELDFVIGTGFHRRGEWEDNFLPIWEDNTMSYSPSGLYCISTGSTYDTGYIGLGNNLGHVGDLLSSNKEGLCGWSHAILSCAMLAYGTGKDLIWKEQDCLWFGPVPERMYSDIGDKGMVFGPQMRTKPYMRCAQSTFLIRNWFLLDFIRQYLSLPHDKDMLPEDKFANLAEQHPQSYGFLSFGVDRERPLPWDSDCWYAQHWTPEELEECARRGLIP